MERNTRGRRWTAVAASAALAAGALAGAQITAASAAAALPGIHVVSSPPSASNSISIKQVQAYCPSTERVIGGGGYIQEVSGTDHKPTLTELRPIYRYDGTRRLPRHRRGDSAGNARDVAGAGVRGVRSESPAPQLGHRARHESALVECRAGEGSGVPGRASGARHRHQRERSVRWRAAAGDPAFRSGRHRAGLSARRRERLRAQLVRNCVRHLRGSTARLCHPTVVIPPFGQSLGSDSESWKIAGSTCPAGKYAHSAGAALNNLAPANVSLQALFPAGGGRSSQAIAVENTPTTEDWDYIVASVVCAS